jgi:hypothetical protein
MAYPSRIYDLVCEDQENWTNYQREVFHNFLWFAEAFGFTFEIHRNNRAESPQNQTWYGSHDAILVFPSNLDDIHSNHNLFFMRFQGDIRNGHENLYAPDMLFALVRDRFHI